MKREWPEIAKFVAAALVAVFLVSGWVTLSRGRAADDRVVLRIWDWWNPAGNPKLGEFFEKVERDFEAAHPHIDIQYQFIPFGTQYIQKLMSAFASGNPPDAFQCSIIWATDLYDRGVIRDLNDLLEDSPEVGPDAFFPISLAYISRDGRVFGIPTSMDANVLMMNTEMLREAGLSTDPFAIESWGQFVEYADRLTVRDENGKVVRAGMLVSATADRFSSILPWLGTQGKSFLTDDLRSTNAATPEGFAAMNFLHDLLHKHNISFPPGGERQDFSLFTQRRAAMVEAGTWTGYGMLEQAPDMEYVMTNFPPGPHDGRRASVTWVNMMMMPKDCRHPKETWEYLRYYGGLEVARDMLVILLRNSPRKDLYDTPEWAEAIEQYPYLRNVAAICASGVMFPFRRFEEINDVFRPYYQQALLGTMPVEDAMREGAARVERVLEGNWADRLLREQKERQERDGADGAPDASASAGEGRR